MQAIFRQLLKANNYICKKKILKKIVLKLPS
jgi:hypothetical protein